MKNFFILTLFIYSFHVHSENYNIEESAYEIRLNNELKHQLKVDSLKKDLEVLMLKNQISELSNNKESDVNRTSLPGFIGKRERDVQIELMSVLHSDDGPELLVINYDGSTRSITIGDVIDGWTFIKRGDKLYAKKAGKLRSIGVL